MLRQQIAELRQRRARLVAEARALMSRREDGNGEVDAETEAQVDKILKEVEDLKRRIERLEALVEEEKELDEEDEDEPEIDAEPLDEEDEEDEEEEDERGRRRRRARRSSIRRASSGKPRTETRDKSRTSSEYRQAFSRFLRGRATSDDRRLMRREARSLNVGEPAEGGYLVPDEFRRLLIQKLEDLNVMRQLAFVDTSVSGTSEIPVEEDIGEATWLGEGEEYTEEDVEFGQVTIGAHKLGRILKVSEELMQDGFFDMETYLSEMFGRAFARGEERAFIDGSGVKQPLGVVRSAAKGADAPASVLVADDVKRLKFGLRAPYRPRATWLMHDETALAISLLKDDNGQYIWRPGLAEGEPDTLLGRPLFTSPYMPKIGSATKSILYGDFSYYWIFDRRALIMQRLNEIYAETGHVGFRAMMRVDGKLTLSEAVVHLAHAEAD